MDWHDQAVILSIRPHGEAGGIASLMTCRHGKHAGLVRGQKRLAALQPGSSVEAIWRARVADHLGTYTLEPTYSPVARVLDDAARLAALASACAVVDAALPDRAPDPEIYHGLVALLEALPDAFWDAVYVLWEIELLQALGFGLDLQQCAVTGTNDALAFVSPKSGRAVSLSAAQGYEDRLLPLPGFLHGKGDADPDAVLAGLQLSGYFLSRRLFAQAHQPVPPARDRFVDRYRKMADSAGGRSRQ